MNRFLSFNIKFDISNDWGFMVIFSKRFCILRIFLIFLLYIVFEFYTVSFRCESMFKDGFAREGKAGDRRGGEGAGAGERGDA